MGCGVSKPHSKVTLSKTKGKPFHSKKAVRWCEEIAKREKIHIQHAENGGEMCIAWKKKNGKSTTISFDGYCKKTNTVYEFHGDYWHGNPKKYDPNKRNEVAGKTFGELYKKTKARERYIKSQGYTLVVMWESEYDKNNSNKRKKNQKQEKMKTRKR